MSLQFGILAYLIPLVPIVSSFIVLFLGKKVDGKANGNIIAISALTISFALTLLISIEVFFQLLTSDGHNLLHFKHVIPWPWLELPPSIKIEIGIMVDPLAIVVLLMVTFIALMVATYSRSYMAHDGSPRYYAEILMFAAAMMTLCLSPNLIQMFIAWEIMGVCSYLLIGYYYEKEEVSEGLPHPASASKKAFLMTKVGDILLMVGIILLFLETETFDFHEISGMIDNIDSGKLAIIAVLMFGGVIGKSAQFPLHVWLPDAMAGPTTVSCLIHSATMVKAGIFLVARNYFIFEHADSSALLFVAVIGGITAIMAGTIALVKTDVKGVLAYSTISQLGYMTIGLGVGGMPAAVFHIVNHGLFKALLFLSAGSIIHGSGTQDIREMGGLKDKMPHTWKATLIGSLSLAGIGNGFFSKDAIIAGAFLHVDDILIYLVWLSAIITAGLTAFYIFRLWFLVFTGENRHPDPEFHAHESDKWMTTPLYLIGGTTLVLAAFFAVGVFIPEISFEHWLHEWLGYHPHDFNFMIAGISLLLAGLGIGLAYLIYSPKMGKIGFSAEDPSFIIVEGGNPLASLIRKFKWTRIGRGIQNVLENGYYIDNLYYYISFDFFYNKFCKLMNWIEVTILDPTVRFIGKIGYGICGVSMWIDNNIVDGIVRSIGKTSIAFCGIFKWTDENIIDNGIVRNIGRGFYGSGRKLRYIQTGVLNNYALYTVLGVIMIICIMIVL